MASETKWYEPTGRYLHQTVLVDRTVYLWAGNQDGHCPCGHDTAEKRAFLSCVETFNLQQGRWEQHVTRGFPPLGVDGYASVAVGNDLHYFAGWCGHDDCYHNSVYKLSTSSFQWTTLAPTTTEGPGPMRKFHCGMVAFRDEEEDLLFAVGGMGNGIPALSQQSGAVYDRVNAIDTETNEQHIFSLVALKWSSPSVSGQVPLPCSRFSLTPLDDNRRAIMSGGTKSGFSELLVVELSKNTVHWSKISRPVDHLVHCPESRRGHAATLIAGTVLSIIGGYPGQGVSEYPLSGFWICDTNTMLWKKLPLSETITKRGYHSMSAVQLGPKCVWLIVFGGKKALYAEPMANTAIVELVQSEDSQWSVGAVMMKPQLVDEYQSWLTKATQQGLPALKQEEVVEQLYQQIYQLQDEKRQMQQMLEQAEESLQQLQQVMTDENKDQPHWVVKRDEVEMTSEVVGRGGWGEVRIAKFRGLRVAAKCLHEMIISPYNLRKFNREMGIAAQVHHPNLLMFMGAVMEGEPIILTELMPTSLRRQLEREEMPTPHITSIAQDVACALTYLHQWRPHPIIHRDISSGNVLLGPLPNGWRALVSDYGSANFVNHISSTVAPGCPIYAAPEARFPDQHSPKMDTFSFGVLLIEMCVRELPEATQEEREAQIQRIQWPVMVSLIRRCVKERPEDRPSITEAIYILDKA